VLIAHLHEHKAAVTRLVAIRNTSYFASGSMDGSVKIWDCIKFEGRNVANRSRQTCTRLVIIGLMILFCILLMPNQFI
jgi:phosphoinositide-3-kinase regulatory subunit 4